MPLEGKALVELLKMGPHKTALVALLEEQGRAELACDSSHHVM